MWFYCCQVQLFHQLINYKYLALSSHYPDQISFMLQYNVRSDISQVANKSNNAGLSITLSVNTTHSPKYTFLNIHF